MVGMLRSYKRHIAEGKSFFIFSIVFAVAIRLAYFFYFDFTPVTYPDGYLFSPLFSLIDNALLSLLLSGVFTVGMAFLAGYLNTEYVFIRRRTALLPAFILLFFSSSPGFIYFSPEYVGAISFLYVILLLFASYNTETKQNASFKVSFILAFGSFFVPVLLLYIPVIWVALAIMRSFNFKAFFTSLLGIFTLYFSAFAFCLFADKLDIFIEPFTSVGLETFINFPFINFNVIQWIGLSILILLFILIVSDNYVNRHKDKIRNRAYLAVLDFITIIAILFFIFLNINPLMNLFIVLISGSFLTAHFYALAERKISVYLFYFTFLFYILICFSPFLSL